MTQLIEEGKQLKVSFEVYILTEIVMCVAIIIIGTFVSYVQYFFQSQRQRLLDQLLEEKKLKSEGDATIALLRNEVAAFEQDTVAKKVCTCLCIDFAPRIIAVLSDIL